MSYDSRIRCVMETLTTLAVSLATFCMVAAAPPPSVRFSKRCLMISPNESCAIADVNRDGKPDIIAGTHWFPAPDFTAHLLRDIPVHRVEYLENNGDHPYDVDGDGWIDVISIAFMQTELCWYENPGKEVLVTGRKWQRHVLVDTNRPKNELTMLHDFDGDGVPEVFINSWNGKDPVVAWKMVKSKDGRPTAKEIVLGDRGGGHGFAFGDINSDGREDILVESGWYERPDGEVLAKPWKFHKETALPHPSAPCVIVDLTGDGRNDIIWGKAHAYGLYWWEQGEPKPDGTTTWKEHLIDKSWSQPHCLAWADLDGDAQSDLITGKRRRAHAGRDPGGNEPACMYYYTWNKQARKFTQHTISPPGDGVGIGVQIAVDDLNGDGRNDLAVSGKTGTWVLINEGT